MSFAFWLAALLPLLVAAPAGAQPAMTTISTDGSLGMLTTVAPDVDGVYEIPDGLGRLEGENLFQSFSEFDIASGDVASFTFTPTMENPAVARVIARVTGGDGTDIWGTLRSEIPDADLFLLDSRGVEFGEGSRLEVDGSFYMSSADVLRFKEGPDFATGDATPDPPLSTAAPIAFGFLSSEPGEMVVAHADRFAVDPGETLSLVGGSVRVSGDLAFFTSETVIDAPGAQLELAAAAGPIDIPVALADFDLAAADPEALGRIEIGSATVDMSGTADIPAGSVMIRGGEFVLYGGSAIYAENRADAPAVGPVDIAVSGALRVFGTNGVDPPTLMQTRIRSRTRGEGAAGDVLLQGDQVQVQNGAQIQLFSDGPDAPDAEISGRVVSIDSGSLVQALGAASEAASRLDIAAEEAISVAGGAVVVSDLRGASEDPGRISLIAPAVRIEGDAQVLTTNSGAGVGTPAEIRGGRLEVADGGIIWSESTGSASQGGTLDVTADEVALTGGGRIASYTPGEGSGGDIEIRAGRLEISDGGGVVSAVTDEYVDGFPTLAPGGPVGDIRIRAGSVLLSNSGGDERGAYVTADDGGSIRVRAEQLELLDGGQIRTRAFADTPAGSLVIAGADTVVASGVDAAGIPSGLFSRSRETASATGTGGLLSIHTRVLELLDGATVSSATFGAADAGGVEVDASERVTVQSGPSGLSRISAAAAPGSSGNGGTIEIVTGLLELQDGGSVSTTTGGSGDAGAIDARADRIEISGVDPRTDANPSGFFSNSNTAGVLGGGGDGGRIELTADEGVFLSNGGTVSADATGSGLAGSIDIDGGKRIEIENASITTHSVASAGGNVKLTAGELVYLLDSTIDTDVLGGAGGGGDVTIDPKNTVLNRSSITARAVEGRGGNILIVTDYYFQSGESFLDASSELGIDGTVRVTSPDTDLTGGLATLPATYLDASALLERDCAARTERAGSFAVRARVPLAAPPDQALTPLDLGYCEGGSP